MRYWELESKVRDNAESWTAAELLSVADTAIGGVGDAWTTEVIGNAVFDFEAIATMARDEVVDGLMLASDYRDLWEYLGEPSPEDMAAYGTISEAIEGAVTEALKDDLELMESAHEGVLEGAKRMAELIGYDEPVSAADTAEGYWDGVVGWFDSLPTLADEN